jgi:peptidoglycan hydrolase CwlO-like protein
MARAREELVSAKHVIDRLEQQLHDVEVAKQQLERKEAELVDLMHHMETERELKQEEREQLMAEMAIRESELVSMREHLSAQNEETIRLQREAEEVRSRQHEVIMHAPPPIVDHHHHQQQPAPFEADHRPASVAHTHRPSSTKSDDYSYDGYEQSPVNNTNRGTF